MMSVYVVKSDGRKEPFYVEKVKKVIEWAVRDANVSPLVLESKFDEFIKDEISTSDIHDNLIYQARTLCSPEAPDWSFVAGRLETMKLWKKTGIYEKTFYYYLKEQIENGRYKHPGLSVWTKREINALGKEIDQDRDLLHSYGSVLTARSKYLLDGECIQQMNMANAMIIASVEDQEKRLDFAKEVYAALSNRKISLATPWLSNLRSNENISSCFIIQVNDTMESIANGWSNAALISKKGGGLGIDLSLIRASKSAINGRSGASKGITSWIKIFNDIAVAVDQGGKRAGAFTVHCPIWHRDIEDFLELQTENGDMRGKAMDVFPQVGMYDIFMKEQAKEDGGTWYTFCPDEVKKLLGFEITGVFGKEFDQRYRQCVKAYKADRLKNVGVYKARELLKSIMKVQFETGLPYISFLDRINETNPNQHDGYIPCVNLCTESFSNVKADELAHVCNLASITVGRVEDKNELVSLARTCCRILDNGITLTKNPISETETHNQRYRTIGIGIQGLHDWVAKKNLQWTDYKDFTELAELIEFGAVQESVALAKERGAYPAFKGSQWDDGSIQERFLKNSVADCDWGGLFKEMKKYGIRNSQLTSPAPNTSTGPYMDASTGVMPVYRAFYNEENRSGKFSVFGMHLTENPLCYERTQPRQNQAELTKLVGALQKFIDTGISAEYVFDLNKPNFSAKDLYDLIVSAWKNKNKAIYYIRSIKKGSTIDDIVGGESVCSGCTG